MYLFFRPFKWHEFRELRDIFWVQRMIWSEKNVKKTTSLLLSCASWACLIMTTCNANSGLPRKQREWRTKAKSFLIVALLSWMKVWMECWIHFSGLPHTRNPETYEEEEKTRYYHFLLCSCSPKNVFLIWPCRIWRSFEEVGLMMMIAWSSHIAEAWISGH